MRTPVSADLRPPSSDLRMRNLPVDLKQGESVETDWKAANDLLAWARQMQTEKEALEFRTANLERRLTGGAGGTGGDARWS